MKINKKAFTLVELLVVVLIIGILAAIAVPQYRKAVLKSQSMQAVTLLKSLVDAEEAYYLAHGEYTGNLSELDITFPTLPDWSYGSALNREEDPQLWIYNSKQNLSFNYYTHVKKMLCQTKKNHEICEALLTTKADCYGRDLESGWSCYYFN